MCKTENADLLQLMAGFPDGKPQMIKELLDSDQQKLQG